MSYSADYVCRACGDSIEWDYFIENPDDEKPDHWVANQDAPELYVISDLGGGHANTVSETTYPQEGICGDCMPVIEAFIEALRERS